MRIIQGHDYYDSALAHGRDDDVVFVREKDRWLTDDEFVGASRTDSVHFTADGKTTDGRRFSIYRGNNRFSVRGVEYEAGLVIVVFCGKVYHGVMIETIHDGLRSATRPTYYWQKDRFSAWMDQLGIAVAPSWRERKPDVAAMFASYDAPKVMMDWLIANKIVVSIRYPARYVDGGRSGFRWSVNSDQLKDVQFFKVFDAYSAFQEIAMWVGGVLPSSGNPMVAISDIVRIEKHGFDKVKSFRNMK